MGESKFLISRRDFFATLGASLVAVPALARFGTVEVGVCAKSADLEKAVHYGFDYLEPAVEEISAMDDAAFGAFKSRVLASPVRCECFNNFIRLRVVGNHVDEQAVKAYLQNSLPRCRELGASIVVWGSSGSRNVHPGFSRDRARQQIKEFLRPAGDTAKLHGIVIAIEPLRRQESNILNTGAETLQMVREIDHPNVKMIIDYYHLREENEDPQIIWTARKEIVHFHFANPNGRVWPKDPGEDPEYGRFFEMVKKIRFHGGISIEARGSFEKDAAASLAFFRRELS